MKPILFNSAMVKAILDGRKTETRRIIKTQEVNERCPYGAVGSVLWVREGHSLERWTPDFGPEPDWPDDGRPIFHYTPSEEDTLYGVEEYWLRPHYRATDPPPDLYDERKDGPSPMWRPSIHMPRWACRIFLEVTDVRVERIQGITEEGARAEGIYAKGALNNYNDVDGYNREIDAFKALWNSINQKRGYGWLKNPWVWVVSFKRGVIEVE